MNAQSVVAVGPPAPSDGVGSTPLETSESRIAEAQAVRHRGFVKLCFAILTTAALALPPSSAAQATGTVTGRVLSEAGEGGLPGAQVVVAGTALATITGADGSYTITDVPAGQQRIEASQIGYGAQARSVRVTAGEVVDVSFQLAPAAVELEEIVAVGYGTQQRRDVTGAVSSVNVDEIPAVATTSSVGQLLQGRVSGAQVVQNNGAPGGGISIRIRGTNSITANSEPLYVIDGMPAYVGSSSQDPYQNPLAAINPQDIESIEVLKDASSTAIYGARGANGVVLITTKQGRRGENEIQFESSFGMQSPARTIDMLNGPQFAALVNEARINSGQEPVFTPEELAEINTAGPGTDWQSLVMRDAPMQSHSLSFSGGDERTRYMVSGSYFDQEGILEGSAFERYSARVNMDRTLTDRLTIGTNFTVSNTDSDFQVTDNTMGHSTVMGALWFNPISPVRDPETGDWIMNSPVTWPVVNPVALVEELLDQRSTLALVGNVFGTYDLLEGLRLRSSLGVNLANVRNRYYAPSTMPLGASNNGEGSASAGQGIDVVNENILTYQRALGESQSLDLTGGFTVQKSRSESVSASNSEFANDATGVYDLGAGTRPQAGTGFSESALISWLGRANYNLLDRYLFTVTGRFDGSSRFGENTKWGFFPSAAVAWRLIEEPFMQNQGLFSDLKLRLGYGQTGNQEIGLYQSLARLGTSNYTFDRAPVVGYHPAGAAPNPDLKWERTRQFNVGLDMGFFANRLTATLDAYDSVTDDLLLAVNLPASSGYNTQLRNVGSVKNRGVELALSTLNIESANVSWRTRLSLAANRNEVLDLGAATEIPGPARNIDGQAGGTTVILREGETMGSFLGYRTDGIYQEGDTCPLTTLRDHLDCVPGEYRYVDVNQDGRINALDRTILGNGHPDFYGGLTNSLTFGAFDLNVFLQGSYGNEVLNAAAINIRNVNATSNQTADALRRWTPENPNTDVPRANSIRPREIYDEHVEDGSYLRLENVTLGYRIPEGLVPSASQVRVYVSGQNLHVWTNYRGYDPEVNSLGGNAISRGIDLGAFPRARTWNIGINATL